MPQGINDWTESEPALLDPRRDGAEEIRAVRLQVRSRLQKEHETPAAGNAGGEHKEGSAKGYYEASAPTNRPDGSTALDSDDTGRLWIDSDNGQVSYWDGTGWIKFAGVILQGSAHAYYSASEPVNRPSGVALDASDVGRLWIDSDNNSIHVWDGTEWDWVAGPVTQQTDISTALNSSGGWENTTGGQALVTITFETTTGTLNEMIQIDYGAGFTEVARPRSDFSYTGSVMVPPGASLRVWNAGTLTNYEAYAQRI